MDTENGPVGSHASGLHVGRVTGVTEDSCEVVDAGGDVRVVPFAPMFPTPRTERVSPGHLVATGPGGAERVVWRWYDAVVLGDLPDGGVRLWEPGHGEVLASRRPGCAAVAPGARAYASAGLDGAAWWVADAVGAEVRDDAVELDDVDALYRDNGLWPAVFAEDEGIHHG